MTFAIYSFDFRDFEHKEQISVELGINIVFQLVFLLFLNSNILVPTNKNEKPVFSLILLIQNVNTATAN